MKSIYIATFFLPLAFAAEYLVGVGKDETTGQKGIGFDPSVIHPAPGDVIAFEFQGGVHSVVQSTFENPCTGNGGFNSGVQSVPADTKVDASGLPVVRLTINDTQSIWLFDEAGGLCSKGALLAVNPTSTQTPAQFAENAANVPASPPPSTLPTPSSSTTGGSPSSSGDPTTASSASSSTTTSNSAMRDTYGRECVYALGGLFLLFGLL